MEFLEWVNLKEQTSVSGHLFISNSEPELLHSTVMAEKLQRFAATLSEWVQRHAINIVEVSDCMAHC